MLAYQPEEGGRVRGQGLCWCNAPLSNNRLGSVCITLLVMPKKNLANKQLHLTIIINK